PVSPGAAGGAVAARAAPNNLAGGAAGPAPPPAGFLHRAATSRAAAELAGGVREGVHPDDVALCLDLDRFPFAMVATPEDSLMVLRPCAVPPPADGAAL
ncbi:2-phosphosulfolactate phosphatase, partial [Streptomyces lavendulae]